MALYSGLSPPRMFITGVNFVNVTGLWAFDGWDQTNYVAGEMKKPERNVPRVIHTSMIIVVVRHNNPLNVIGSNSCHRPSFYVQIFHILFCLIE